LIEDRIIIIFEELFYLDEKESSFSFWRMKELKVMGRAGETLFPPNYIG